MSPLGIGLAFLVFWTAIALGLFLFFFGLISLGKARAVYGVAVEHAMHRMAVSAAYAAILVVGLALVAAGVYANYVVLYR
jgi:hypothetical protein